MVDQPATGTPATGTPANLNAYFNPDSAAVIQGAIVPGANIIQAAIAKLKDDIVNNPTIAQAWKDDPHSVLSARGFYSDLQTNVLQNSGIATPEGWCVISKINSGCCVSASDVRLKRKIQPLRLTLPA